MAQLGALEAHRVDATGTAAGSELVLVHGFGLGGWMWSRDQDALAAAGHASWAVDLPGHGADSDAAADLDALVAGLASAVAALDAPVLVAHGGGALVAQIVAERTNLSALVLINPLPPGGVRYRPDMAGAQALIGALPTLLGGRVALSLQASSTTSLAALPEGERSAVHARTTPWPAGLSRSLLRRPQVTPTGVPTLVLTGLQDHVVPSATARLVGDFHNAVTWRFDDVGHVPALEPSGHRVLGALVEWLQDPQPRKVLEIHGFNPSEGVGGDARDGRVPKKTARSSSRFLERNKKATAEAAFKGDDSSAR